MTKGNFLTFQCIIYTHTHTHTHTRTIYPVFTKKNIWVTYFEPNLILSLQATFWLLTPFIFRSISTGDTGKPANYGSVLW